MTHTHTHTDTHWPTQKDPRTPTQTSHSSSQLPGRNAVALKAECLGFAPLFVWRIVRSGLVFALEMRISHGFSLNLSLSLRFSFLSFSLFLSLSLSLFSLSLFLGRLHSNIVATLHRIMGLERARPTCWHGGRCPWHRLNRCFFAHDEEVPAPPAPWKQELSELRELVRRLTATGDVAHGPGDQG